MEIKPSWAKLKNTLRDSYTAYIPNQIFIDERLHASSIKVFGIINSLCFGSKSDCYPSQALIAFLANISIKTVSRAIKELKICGYIKVQFRKGFSCIYTIIDKFARNVVNTIKNRANSTKEKKQDKKQRKQNTWNYPERNYSNDYLDNLEKRLLGWDIQQDLNGNLYEQGCIV